MLDLKPIAEMILGPGTKGLPIGAAPLRLGDIGGAGWRLHEDLQLPAAVLRRAAIQNNADWMRRFAERFGVMLCPHGKTTMAPQIFDRQLRDGAWGLSCATMAHLLTYRRFGVRRVIYANQIVGAGAALWLARELARDSGFEAHVFVDSVEGIDLLADAAHAAALDRPIPLLVELGAPGARTGVRGVEPAVALARHVAVSRGVALAGFAAFEGVVPGRSDAEMEPHVDALLGDVATAAERSTALFDEGARPILSAGGSRFFDIAAHRLCAADLGGLSPLVVLRSGCYISHDAIQYETAFQRMLERTGGTGISGRLCNALEVWAEVQSRPEAGWLYATFGKRDISYDAELPRALAYRGASGGETHVAPGDLHVRRLSDQHAHIEVKADAPYRMGDRLAFGVSHPCTTFDKWRFLFEVDEDDRVVDAIATFF